jgi:hypothetical protein
MEIVPSPSDCPLQILARMRPGWGYNTTTLYMSRSNRLIADVWYQELFRTSENP